MRDAGKAIVLTAVVTVATAVTTSAVAYDHYRGGVTSHCPNGAFCVPFSYQYWVKWKVTGTP